MQAKLQNILSFNANRMIFRFSGVAKTVLRAACGQLLRLSAHTTSINNQATLLRLAMLRRLAAHKNIILAGLSGLSTMLAIDGIVGRAPRQAVRAAEPVRQTVEDHWRRATGTIAAAVAGFQRIKSLHVEAARQLDSADYALTQLLHDLRPAMALPADVSGLRAILAEAERTAPVPRPKAALAA